MLFNSFPPPFLIPNLKWALSKGLFLQHWMLPLLNSSVLFQTEIEDRPPSRREEASSPSLLGGQDAALLQKIKALIINAALGQGRQGAV